MVLAARAEVANAEHGRMRGARQPVELPEVVQPHPGLATGRARERVAGAQCVVHALISKSAGRTELLVAFPLQNRGNSILDQREDVVAFEPVATVQEGELDDER